MVVRNLKDHIPVFKEVDDAWTLGTSGVPIKLVAGTPSFAMYITNAGTSGSTSAEGFFVQHTLTGAGQVGGRARFRTSINIAAGGWANALKTHMVFGASGSASGLGSSLNAELELSAGTSVGTYAPLESEIVMGTNAVTGTATSFLYMNVTGAAAATFDTNGYLFEIGAGITQGSGKFFDSDANLTNPQIDHSLRIRIEGATYYIPLMDNANGS